MTDENSPQPQSQPSPLTSKSVKSAQSSHEDYEDYENLDDLDWGDVEQDLKANRDRISTQNPTDPSASETEAATSSESSSQNRAPSPELEKLGNLASILLPVTVELGRTRMSIQSLLALNPGTRLVLDHQEGEPLNLFVGDQLWAKGELVVADEKLGVRILEKVASNPSLQ
ncbi:MAG: FliM/FliN family flagellar motor switch protein [SAR324 cluster bacterium]|nr:FliM/FliN family flagellar motor switch protein [SAR324 cluster bacterium]